MLIKLNIKETKAPLEIGEDKFSKYCFKEVIKVHKNHIKSVKYLKLSRNCNPIVNNL